MARPYEIPGLTPDMYLAEAAHRVLLTRFEQMAEYRLLVLADTDIENLHDMRVASRRLRAAWRCFDGVFAGRRIRRFQREARQITCVLGEVRDLDVLGKAIAKVAHKAPPALHDGFDSLLDFIAIVRQHAFEPLEETLSTWDPGIFLDEFPALEPRPFAYQVRLVEQTQLVLTELTDNFLAWHQTLEDPTAIESHHAMRIAGKRLRYALEIFGCAVADSDQLIHTLQNFQENLGDLHDADVMLALLERRYHVCLPIEHAMLEWLLEHYRLRRLQYYEDTRHSWHQAVVDGFVEQLQFLERTEDFF
ncbi:MAG: CHAD domain-containing protein [Blastocatellia bacterium]|nr:CHAD domain-containing protein [Blastocatellia bacterium]